MWDIYDGCVYRGYGKNKCIGGVVVVCGTELGTERAGTRGGVCRRGSERGLVGNVCGWWFLECGSEHGDLCSTIDLGARRRGLSDG